MSRRVQDAITDGIACPGVEKDRLRTRALAGVLLTGDPARRNGLRRASRTCALWARISEHPGQTDTGGPRKVSRRVQDAITDGIACPGAEKGRLRTRALAGVLPTGDPARRNGPPRGPRRIRSMADYT